MSFYTWERKDFAESWFYSWIMFLDFAHSDSLISKNLRPLQNIHKEHNLYEVPGNELWITAAEMKSTDEWRIR